MPNQPPKKPTISTASGKPAKPADSIAAASKQPFMDKQTKKEAVELVRLRNDFYRDNYRRLIAILLLLLVFMFAMVYWIYYLTSHRPSPRYFATNAAGGLIPLKPLSESSLSDIALQNWTVRAATTTFTFNYVQLNQQLENAKDTYFTSAGGQAFMTTLVNSGDLDAVNQGKFIVTSEPTGAPEILSRGIMDAGSYKGRFAWVVQVPLQINYESVLQNISSHRTVNVQMTVVRTSPLVDNSATNIDSLQGIGISQLLVQSTANVLIPTPASPTAQASGPVVMTAIDQTVAIHPSLSMAV
ncbi:MAG: DotI/IcmL/TraM family protein [Gammaproteobacteria bacterium]|nr:DotI/IcmL/TraM family protein [Gammaproteobacteria bacterium]